MVDKTDRRQLRDMRRSGVIEVFTGADERAAQLASEKIGNTINRSKSGRSRKGTEGRRSAHRGPAAAEQRLKRFSEFRKNSSLSSARPYPNSLILLERVKGIEPSYSAWKAGSL
jgi:hypothetical protein